MSDFGSKEGAIKMPKCQLPMFMPQKNIAKSLKSILHCSRLNNFANKTYLRLVDITGSLFQNVKWQTHKGF